MAIPEFQEFMLPFLRIAGDGKEHSLPEAVVTLADQMKITRGGAELALVQWPDAGLQPSCVGDDVLEQEFAHREDRSRTLQDRSSG